ncbi:MULTISPECIES: hypothetical protein [unclassified Luteimonas]
MPRTIDPVKLKAAAERLEWVLRQYPDCEDVQDLLHALEPLLGAATGMDLSSPLDRWEIPGTYNLADGLYTPCKAPDVHDAYVAFSIELRGGLTEEEGMLHERIEEMQKS